MSTEQWKELESYIEELQTISVDPTLSSSRFLSITGSYYHLNNGKTIYREEMKKDQSDGSAVIILPMTEEGKCILTVEPRVFTKKTVGIGFPAGYLNVGEDYLEAASRELLEETGYQAETFLPLAEFYQDEGCSAAYNYGVFATGCRKVGNQKLDEGEFIRYFLCDFEEVEELIQKKYMVGANSQLVYEKAKRLLKK